MDTNISSNKWTDVHVPYANYIEGKPNLSFSEGEIEWKKRLLATPNGHLLTNNSFFNLFKNADVIYLQHTTRNLKTILKQKKICSSGGCLVGSIYCTPLIKTGNNLRMHNLGKYIYDIEAPLMNMKEDSGINTLIFEVTLSKDSNKDLLGIDHLRMGNIYFSIYEEIKELFTIDQIKDIQDDIVTRVKKSTFYFTECIQTHNHLKFCNLLVETIDQIPVLEYFYFVAISEYLMLYEDSPLSRKYHQVGELYNPTYKDLMYKFLDLNSSPNLFKPSISDVVTYIEKERIFMSFDKEGFMKFVAHRIIYLTNSRLFNSNNSFSRTDAIIDFEGLTQTARPLVGHLVNYILKTKFSKVFSTFEQKKALQVWNYWNLNNIQIPFNGVIPKGEVGINPSFPNFKIKTYIGKVISGSEFSFVEPLELLDIDIVPELVNTKFTVMRDSVKTK